VTPADIRRLVPAAFEFLWRTILNREHGASYRHVDAHGIDCLTDNTAYQLYHHQGAAWSVVQGKFRDDLQAAQRVRAKGLFPFDAYVFVSTFAFREPGQRAWLETRKSRARPLRVVTWGEEHLCDQLARHPDLAAQFGLGPLAAPTTIAASTGTPDDPADLRGEAVSMLERLLAAPGETLTLADLREQSGLGEHNSESDFKLVLHSLIARGLVRVTGGPATATLLDAGKDYLVRERVRLAAERGTPE
jgi:hypothetical protein